MIQSMGTNTMIYVISTKVNDITRVEVTTRVSATADLFISSLFGRAYPFVLDFSKAFREIAEDTAVNRNTCSITLKGPGKEVYIFDSYVEGKPYSHDEVSIFCSLEGNEISFQYSFVHD